MATIKVLEGPMKGVHFEIDKEVVFVGRSAVNDINILDETVSRKHLKIVHVEGCYFVEDLKTTNGTIVNGELLDAGFSRLLTEGDRIQLGFTVLHLEGIGVNAMPVTLGETRPHASEKADGPVGSEAYLGAERRSRVFREMDFIDDLLQFMVERPKVKQLLEKVAESLLEAYPRIDRVSAFLFDAETNRMEEVVSRRKEITGKKPSSPAKSAKAVLDQVVRDGKTVAMYLKADGAAGDPANVQDGGTATAVNCLPLTTTRKTRGAIYIEGAQETNPVRMEDFLLLKTVKRLLDLSLEMEDLSVAAEPQSRTRQRA